MDKPMTEIEELINKAAKADTSEDALRFSQAACSVANALCALGNERREASRFAPSQGSTLSNLAGVTSQAETK